MRCLSACPCEADAMHVRRGRAMLQRCMIPKAVRSMRFQTAHAKRHPCEYSEYPCECSEYLRVCVRMQRRVRMGACTRCHVQRMLGRAKSFPKTATLLTCHLVSHQLLSKDASARRPRIVPTRCATLRPSPRW